MIGSYCQTGIFTVTDMVYYDSILERPWLPKVNHHLNWRTNGVNFCLMSQSVFFCATADWKTEKLMADIPSSVPAAEARRLKMDDGT